MGIATNTVDTYLRRIRLKSGAGSAAELIRLGMSLEDGNDNDGAAEKS
jgi:DNA-binding CsgD family transcriptional regulator